MRQHINYLNYQNFLASQVVQVFNDPSIIFANWASNSTNSSKNTKDPQVVTSNNSSNCKNNTSSKSRNYVNSSSNHAKKASSVSSNFNLKYNFFKKLLRIFQVTLDQVLQENLNWSCIMLTSNKQVRAKSSSSSRNWDK